MHEWCKETNRKRAEGELTVFGGRSWGIVGDEVEDLICIDHRGQHGYIGSCKSDIVLVVFILVPASFVRPRSSQVKWAILAKRLIVNVE